MSTNPSRSSLHSPQVVRIDQFDVLVEPNLLTYFSTVRKLPTICVDMKILTSSPHLLPGPPKRAPCRSDQLPKTPCHIFQSDINSLLYTELEQHICASRFNLIQVKTGHKDQSSPPGRVLNPNREPRVGSSLNSLRKPQWLVGAMLSPPSRSRQNTGDCT